MHFEVNRYVDVFQNEGDMSVRFRLEGEYPTPFSDYLAIDMYGGCVAEDVPLRSDSSAAIRVELTYHQGNANEGRLGGSATISPAGGKPLYVFLDPVTSPVTVTETTTTGETNSSAVVQHQEGGEMNAGIMPGGIGVGSKQTATDTTTAPTTSATRQTTRSVQTIHEVPVKLIVTVSLAAPQQTSERAGARASEA